MKLFFRDHLALTFIYFFQLAAVILVFCLDGKENGATIGYACFLSTCIYVGYLFFRYFANKSFYQRLSTPLLSLHDLSMKQQAAPLPESFDRLQKNLIHHYEQEIYDYKHKLDHHTQFMNQWVHQMKTPISVIHLLIQDLEDEVKDSIDEELDRLRKGLEMVLYNSRLESFERDFHVETIQLSSLVRTMTSTQKRLFIRNRVYPEIDIDPNIVITSDEKWLSFVLLQLTTNAVKYTANKGERILYRVQKKNGHILLEVVDHGIGIPTSDLPRVFDPYFTGENGRKFQESTGMGLYLVKQICDKLGHQVKIESDLEQGTTVQIFFSM
ncbi:ATP-binding protein [Cytobacillus sp. Hz8]|uniref:ATP-binding protein n=1 Tax=Cytobacillus sp. Hz8 TaxID=3347168 RepID=UPI0035E2B945